MNSNTGFEGDVGVVANPNAQADAEKVARDLVSALTEALDGDRSVLTAVAVDMQTLVHALRSFTPRVPTMDLAVAEAMVKDALGRLVPSAADHDGQMWADVGRAIAEVAEAGDPTDGEWVTLIAWAGATWAGALPFGSRGSDLVGPDARTVEALQPFMEARNRRARNLA